MHNCTLTYILLVIYLYTVTEKFVLFLDVFSCSCIGYLAESPECCSCYPRNCLCVLARFSNIEVFFHSPTLPLHPKKLLQWILAKFLTQETFHIRQSEQIVYQVNE